jgi:DNA modification methylase
VGTVITDPPYNIGYRYNGYKDNCSEDEYFGLLSLACRTPSVVVHYIESLFKLSWVLEEIPRKVVSWVYPSNTARQWRGIAYFGTPNPDFSSMGQDYKNPNDRRIRKLIEQGKSARLYDWWEVNQVKNVSKQKTEHPCQIPELVMERIIKSLPASNIIIDPFLGSGTTAVVAKRFGRKCIGIEISEEYCELATIRYIRSLGGE